MGKEIAQLFVVLGLDDKHLAKGLDRTVHNLQNVGKIVAGIGLAITASLGIAVKMAEEERQSVGLLANTLRNVGIAYTDVREELNKVFADTQRKTNFGDSQQRDALNQLIITTGSYEKGLKLLPLALDLAAAKSMDAGTAAELLGRVMEGNTSVLTRYGIQLKAGASAAEALDAVQEKVAGSAEAIASPFTILGNMMGKLAEEVGTSLLPSLKLIVDHIIPIILGMQQWIAANPELSNTLIGVAAALGVLASIFGPILAMLPLIVQGITMLAGTFLALGGVVGGLIGLAIVALIAAIWLLWKNWDTVWGWIKQTTEIVVNWIIDRINTLINWLYIALELLKKLGVNVQIPTINKIEIATENEEGTKASEENTEAQKDSTKATGGLTSSTKQLNLSQEKTIQALDNLSNTLSQKGGYGGGGGRQPGLQQARYENYLYSFGLRGDLSGFYQEWERANPGQEWTPPPPANNQDFGPSGASIPMQTNVRTTVQLDGKTIGEIVSQHMGEAYSQQAHMRG